MQRLKRKEQEIAKERMSILFRLANEVFHENKLLAKRYLDLAKRISMRSKVRIPKEYKIFICKSCGNLLVPGINCRVRVRNEKGTIVVMSCLDCGAIKRYPAIKEKILKRNLKNLEP
ncbi:MAG: ribonuclease P protein component 4 [Candidatus Bathyarchaeia archaeon]